MQAFNLRCCGVQSAICSLNVLHGCATSLYSGINILNSCATSLYSDLNTLNSCATLLYIGLCKLNSCATSLYTGLCKLCSCASLLYGGLNLLNGLLSRPSCGGRGFGVGDRSLQWQGFMPSEAGGVRYSISTVLVAIAIQMVPVGEVAPMVSLVGGTGMGSLQSLGSV